MTSSAVSQMQRNGQYHHNMKRQSQSAGELRNIELQKYGLMAQGINPKDVVVFQPKDWTRIQNNLSKYNFEKERNEVQKRDRLELHDKSKNLVQHWENTIEGQRLKKLQARNIREEQEEKERQKIDIEEAKLQAEKRKVAIERAKQLQYFETDRVKGFHGALLLTEVLKERDAQIEMKNNKSDWQKEREKFLLEQQRKSYENAIRAEQEKARTKYDKAFDVSQFHLLQIQDKEQAKVEEKERDLDEGKTVKEQYAAFQAAKDVITQRNKNYKKVLKDTYLHEIVRKKDQIAQDKIQEEKNVEGIRKFVGAKRKMTKMRKMKEQEMFEAFQNHTQKMSDKLKAEMQQKVDDEDDRIARAVAEREKKRLEDIEMKQMAEKNNFEATKQHRLQMMNDAKITHEESMVKDRAFLEQRMKADKDYEKKVISDKAEQRTKLSDLQAIHRNQIEIRYEKLKREKEKQIESDAKNTELLVKEEEIFQEYANKVVEDAKSLGRNPFPLSKAKTEGPGGGRGPKFEGNAGLRPSYIVADATGVQLPHYIKDESLYNRVYGHVGKSTKRLGFSW